MNKYQNKLNKETNNYIKESIKESCEDYSPSLILRGCGKTNHSIQLLKKLVILNSKSYYRWVRKAIRSQTKVGFKL